MTKYGCLAVHPYLKLQRFFNFSHPLTPPSISALWPAVLCSYCPLVFHHPQMTFVIFLLPLLIKQSWPDPLKVFLEIIYIFFMRPWEEGFVWQQLSCEGPGWVHLICSKVFPKKRNTITKGRQKKVHWRRSSFWFPSGFPIEFPYVNMTGSIGIFLLSFLPLPCRQVNGCCWIRERVRDCETGWETHDIDENEDHMTQLQHSSSR